ncbi:MAG: flagellar biosynthesis protein FlhF [Deltaproteobacteria bacterium]|nr:flagellar biosynthesis protein FlhF [Deltaproteobacteria bacterium]
MQIKRYEVNNLREAMAQIKKELGPDAIILSTKKMTGSPLIEVTAARDNGLDLAASLDKAVGKNFPRQDDDIRNLTEEISGLKSSIDLLTQKVFQQKNMLNETMDVLWERFASGIKDHLYDVYVKLVENGISRSRAANLVETIKNEFPSESCDTYEKGTRIAEKLIARSILKDDQKERRIKAFIGPTGVGKTTTLAKLAAHYSLDKKLKVGLITTDTYRIAATEQLKIYAKIMGLPLDIASEKKLFDRSVAKFSDKDMILVDTPGRNQYDEGSLKSLKNTLDTSVETVLLINPSVREEYLVDTAEQFKMFDYHRIILTKVDECRHLGLMYDVLDEIRKPVSYVTTGQNVPRDIEKASPERLARMILQN